METTIKLTRQARCTIWAPLRGRSSLSAGVAISIASGRSLKLCERFFSANECLALSLSIALNLDSLDLGSLDLESLDLASLEEDPDPRE